jgi:tetraacyldisaccharide 4'-kinase
MERKIIKILRYILAPILALLVSLYYFAFLLIKYIRIKKQKKFQNIKVICIGNFTLGGSGKTTVVKKIVEDLKKLGKSCGIITRGYKRKNKNDIVLLLPEKNYGYDYVEKVGDEAFMLFSKLSVPICVSSDRNKAIEILKDKVSIVISDDGYQNFSFHKDLNVLVINLFDFKNINFLFPLGNLREPIGSAIKRADYVILNHSKFINSKVVEKAKQRVKKFNKKAKIITSYYKIDNFVNLYTKKSFFIKDFTSHYLNVNICCGLGGGEKIFVNMLRLEGLNVKNKFFYPDHYRYKIEDVKKWAKFNLPLVLTHKDAVKLFPYLDKLDKFYFEKIFYINIKLEIDEGKDIWKEMINTI